jgi:hypothetical protein
MMGINYVAAVWTGIIRYCFMLIRHYNTERQVTLLPQIHSCFHLGIFQFTGHPLRTEYNRRLEEKNYEKVQSIEASLIFCLLCIIMYHNSVTNLIRFHFHKHFIVP